QGLHLAADHAVQRQPACSVDDQRVDQERPALRPQRERLDPARPTGSVPFWMPGRPAPDALPGLLHRPAYSSAPSSQTAMETVTVPGFPPDPSRTAWRALRSADPARSISSSKVPAWAGQAAMPTDARGWLPSLEPA